MTEQSFFVTGATGFIGRELCRQLRAAGHHVRGLVRRTDEELASIGVEQILGDAMSAVDWMHTMTGMHAIIHCAAHASFSGGAELAGDNLRSTRQIIEAASQGGAPTPRLVFVSSIGAVDRPAGDTCLRPLDESSPAVPTSPYGRSKEEGERLVCASGLPFCIVRPAMVVGMEMRRDSHFSVFVRAAVRRSPISWVAWPGRFSVVTVQDVARALILAATHPAAEGRTFFCAGETMSLADCFRLVRPQVSRLPVRWPTMLSGRLPFRLKALLRPALIADDTPLRALGWIPRVPAAEALRGVIAREQARFSPLVDVPGQCVITGAASGLGRAVAERLAPYRRRLLLVDRDAAGLSRVKASFPHARIRVVDLADETAVDAFLRSSDWREDPVSEVFACAGFAQRGTVEEIPATNHARLFQVNLISRLRLAHAAMPAMRRARFGRIVLIASSSAFQPLPYLASYAASNAALLHLGAAWTAELKGTGVDLLTVCPGGMQTNFQASAGVRQVKGEHLMPPEEVATRIIRALPAGGGVLIVSARAWGMALLARLLPRTWSVMLWQRLMLRLR